MVTNEHNFEVIVTTHTPETETLLEDMQERLRGAPIVGSVFMNPIVTVFCERPTTEFFQVSHTHQKRWCGRASKFIGKSTRKSVSSWVTQFEETSKLEKFLSRSLQFTGVLLVDGLLVPSHERNRFKG